VKRVAFALFSSIAGLVMLLGFKTHSTAHPSTSSLGVATGGTNSGDGTTSGNGTAQSSTPAATASTPAGTAKSAATSTSKTYTGTAADTRYGPVQVKITVSNGKITAVDAVDYPQSEPRDQEINAYAIPQLNSETLSAQSSKIDMVSGATYTSGGYIQSLQSALDQAGL
jgi:uncharacterized protein with FMN-binding domain